MLATTHSLVSDELKHVERAMTAGHAALADASRGGTGRNGNAESPNDNIAKAIQHLELALDQPISQTNPNILATKKNPKSARTYATYRFNKKNFSG